MNGQDLKNSILQLAIQGKLVEQREEEGTAKELLEQIKIEKEKLIKEKKIKKTKKLPEIKEDEIPFDIPDSWEWVKLGDVFDIIMGQSPKGTCVFEGNDGIEFHQGKVFFGEDYLQNSNQSTDKPTKVVEPNTVLLCVRAPVGIVNITERKICIGRGLCGINTLAGMNAIFVMHTLRAFRNEFIKKATGTTFVAITGEVVQNQLFPLPPLEEQKRIVAKIEELMPYVDKYDKAYSEVEELNKKFPEDMQKSILQYAIQGKLVEQREEEGTTEELYQQIQEEKNKLIKEGKIKNPTKLPEITEKEIPFDIPENWKWVRIGEIFNLQAGKNITSSSIFESQSEENNYPCYGGNGLRGYVRTFNREGKYALIGRQGALCGNINYAKGKFYATEHAVVVDHFELTDVMWSGYFLKALNLNQYATATAQPGLAVSNIVKKIIPLPPLEEQKRIVAKIEELIPYCQQLVKYFNRVNK